ncbi:phage DNA packing protein [Ameyamaea chiangmaiensis NBRC 103196]|uniref:Terminase small subunit n=1 Tax=Ameyamaea chiangmaiensis TaxID=442969 RepID=A0A850PDA8_9PROT|nr:terminase small subunit [Ameyamaea chiangmaiensis]MBS4075457.1 terminase small subunit [Ameyamaea chiangmaiensis]NVN39011.1 terminase small subunit [Ameyamaea chiangmaiensis]GBQ69693.1 phage DNA packing protein [Ameyamaea chiangmaiensis NBRC 103196]
MDQVSAPATAMTVNKRELARLLRVSLPTLTSWLDKWPEFPVVERGTNGVNWQFSVDDVVTFLSDRQAEEQARKADRDEELMKLQLTLDLGLKSEPESLPSSRVPVKEQIDLMRLQEMKVRQAEKCRQLVKVDEFADLAGGAFAQIARESGIFVRRLCQELNCSDAQLRHAEIRFADMQRGIVEKVMRAMESGDDAGEQPELQVA